MIREWFILIHDDEFASELYGSSWASVTWIFANFNSKNHLKRVHGTQYVHTAQVGFRAIGKIFFHSPPPLSLSLLLKHIYRIIVMRPPVEYLNKFLCSPLFDELSVFFLLLLGLFLFSPVVGTLRGSRLSRQQSSFDWKSFSGRRGRRESNFLSVRSLNTFFRFQSEWDLLHVYVTRKMLLSTLSTDNRSLKLTQLRWKYDELFFYRSMNFFIKKTDFPLWQKIIVFLLMRLCNML